MGRVKEMWIEAAERGFGYVEGHVCAACVDDPALKEFIDAGAVETKCDYCDQASDEPIAAVADEVVDHIAESIKTEYELAVNVLGWDSAEGGYLGKHFDMGEMLDFELDQPLGDGSFAEAVKAAATDDEWTESDYYGTTEDDALRYDWDLFVETVKHGSRFMFLRLDEAPPDEEWIVGHAVRRGNALLAELAKLIERNGLIRQLPTGTSFYRCRTSDTNKVYSTAKDLGTPPPDRAMANRMSAAGIATFYGASDEETAITETAQLGDAVASVGRFVSDQTSWIVDLDKIPEIPSIFDEANRHKRRPLRFLRRFRHDIGKAIERDGREHIEYVPTQIVTEYLRLVYRLPEGGHLNGLAFTSSKTGGQNVALFVTREACLDEDEAPETDGLHLVLEAAHARDLSWPVHVGAPRPNDDPARRPN